ncbi:MAG: hypothetical protein KZQ95_20615 [Candidatus Thiodiazotropha sp. (ex Epidulcina cf. delphinae)]|nr:hypothetical protein [Candidatus Thiodiazotropha sp. (ex Epidulcina cf. delphinae)]
MDVPFTDRRMEWQALVKRRNAGLGPWRASLRARRQAIVRVVAWLGKGAPFPAPRA